MTDEYRDELPEDLQPSHTSPEYAFPNTSRRLWFSFMTFVFAVLSFALWIHSHNGVLVNSGSLVLAIVLAVLSIYFIASGWTMRMFARDALASGAQNAGFVVGHASTHLGWLGMRSRPTWRVLLYSHENPPRERSVVLVDAVDQHVVSAIRESNPEDWSNFTE
jgi:hypothetical protein